MSLQDGASDPAVVKDSYMDNYAAGRGGLKEWDDGGCCSDELDEVFTQSRDQQRCGLGAGWQAGFLGRGC